MVLDKWAQLNVQTKPVEPLVEGGAQIQQVLNIECLTDFSDAPLLNIKFRWAHTTDPSILNSEWWQTRNWDSFYWELFSKLT